MDLELEKATTIPAPDHVGKENASPNRSSDDSKSIELKMGYRIAFVSIRLYNIYNRTFTACLSFNDYMPSHERN